MRRRMGSGMARISTLCPISSFLSSYIIYGNALNPQSRENTMKRNGAGILRPAAGSLVFLAAFAIASAAAGAYHLIKKIPIPGNGGWDYVATDSDARRLYVSHDTEIVVLDLDSGAIVGKIAGGPDMHGAAIASEFGRGFISESNPGSVVIFNLKTLAKIGEVRVGDDPNGIIYDHLTKRIFTADRGSKRITAIDAETGKIAGTIENLGGRTEHLASDEAGYIFLNMQDRNTLLKLDAKDLKVLETWPTAPCQAPSSMDMDRVHARILIRRLAWPFFRLALTAYSRFSGRMLRTNIPLSKMCKRKRGRERWPSIEKLVGCMLRPRNLVRARLHLLKTRDRDPRCFQARFQCWSSGSSGANWQEPCREEPGNANSPGGGFARRPIRRLAFLCNIKTR